MVKIIPVYEFEGKYYTEEELIKKLGAEGIRIIERVYEEQQLSTNRYIQ